MKWLPFAGIVCFAALASVTPPVTGVRSVYVMPMSRGMDQYLANRLTRAGVLEVVNDPQKADAVLTDHIGETLQDRLKEINAPPPPPKKETKSDENESTKAAKDSAAESAAAYQPPPSTFGRSHGTVFLVDRHNGNVLWSVYERPKNSRPGELDHTAGKIVRDLKHALQPQK